jgi:aspartate/methionine/tyrosine aminotransferase
MSTQSKKFDLAWGESVAVRSAFLETLTKPVIFDYTAMEQLGYPAHEGDPALIELTRKVIKRQTGNDYQHILLTNGATGGVTIALRSLAQSRWIQSCITRDAPFFRLYPSMIKAAGMVHFRACQIKKPGEDRDSVYLVDSLSNPLGTFSTIKKNLWDSPIIWDAVYFGGVYSPGNHPQPAHDILVGSYSKLTGLNGVRIGWIATNDAQMYNRMRPLVIAEYCGLSAASTKIILETAGRLTEEDWKSFERNAHSKLNWNREEFSKLEKYFGGTPVSLYGMFYYAPMDAACKKLMEKSGVVWSHGLELGADNNFGRFNIGQDVRLVAEAVKTVLKNDKI